MWRDSKPSALSYRFLWLKKKLQKKRKTLTKEKRKRQEVWDQHVLHVCYGSGILFLTQSYWNHSCARHRAKQWGERNKRGSLCSHVAHGTLGRHVWEETGIVKEHTMQHIESVQMLLVEMLDRCSGTNESCPELGSGTVSSLPIDTELCGYHSSRPAPRLGDDT